MTKMQEDNQPLKTSSPGNDRHRGPEVVVVDGTDTAVASSSSPKRSSPKRRVNSASVNDVTSTAPSMLSSTSTEFSGAVVGVNALPIPNSSTSSSSSPSSQEKCNEDAEVKFASILDREAVDNAVATVVDDDVAAASREESSEDTLSSTSSTAVVAAARDTSSKLVSDTAAATTTKAPSSSYDEVQSEAKRKFVAQVNELKTFNDNFLLVHGNVHVEGGVEAEKSVVDEVVDETTFSLEDTSSSGAHQQSDVCAVVSPR